ncbi:hypothetical protein D3C85_835840 [compost metagenome]
MCLNAPRLAKRGAEHSCSVSAMAITPCRFCPSSPRGAKRFCTSTVRSCPRSTFGTCLPSSHCPARCIDNNWLPRVPAKSPHCSTVGNRVGPGLCGTARISEGCFPRISRSWFAMARKRRPCVPSSLRAVCAASICRTRIRCSLPRKLTMC